ncbi:MAG TPA: GDP-mannose 4,6-dehydratase [Armatimonadota bacterium]|jgi:GDP-4-dehydro-6-deoxy-D-mannose reductase
MARESILITGVSGFVGKHLVGALSGRDIHGTCLCHEAGLEIPGVKMIPCDLEDQASVESAVRLASPSVVYHLAAQSSVKASLDDPSGTHRINVLGTAYLLEALRNQPGVRVVIQVSSAEVYGIVSESETPLSEESPLKPGNPYSWSKALAEMLSAGYCRDFGLPIVTLRPFNHIGPGQSDKFVSSNFARQIAEIEAGIRLPQIMVGNLEARRDFTDVRDIVRAYDAAAQKCVPGEIYNIASGRAVAISEILSGLLSLTPAKVEVVTDPARMRPSDLPVLLGDSSKFRTATGWSPNIPLAETLQSLLDYWRRSVGMSS